MAKNRRRTPSRKKQTKQSRSMFLSLFLSDNILARLLTRCVVGQVIVPIDTLPDEVLLVIFHFFVDKGANDKNASKKEVDAWQSLVHVCRRWRSVVFGSPRRLNLRLLCETKTLVSTLDIWPPLPLVIQGGVSTNSHAVAVLERSNRVCQINLFGYNTSPMENVLAAMQQPFPELTDLEIKVFNKPVEAIPDSFLGGSSPRLRCLKLDGIPFPGLPKLLLSATHLVDFQLRNIPHSGYMSPEAMVTALSTLTSLEILILKSMSSRSSPNWASQPSPPTRSLLPVLGTLRFEGVQEYFDDLVARIDAPRLNGLSAAFINQDVLDTPQFIQLIRRTSAFEVLETAHVSFEVDGAWVELSSKTLGYEGLKVRIPCGALEEQLEFLEEVFSSCLPPLSTGTPKDLYISESICPQPDWPEDDIDNTLWLEVLRPFIAVKNLYLSEVIASSIAPALQELVGDRTTEVLPALEKIFLEGPRPRGHAQKGIREFISARKLSGHPITVSPLPERERDWEWELGY